MELVLGVIGVIVLILSCAVGLVVWSLCSIAELFGCIIQLL